jgi:uncharacterized protein involved in outer membrane biogenesis
MSLAALVLLPLVLLAAAELAGWPFLRQPVQQALERAAHVPVRLDGDFRAHLLWRPRLVAEALHVGPGAGLALPHLVQARDVTLVWRWSDVWRWRQGHGLRIEALHAVQVDARLQRLADGRASWQIGRPALAPPATAASASIAAPSPSAPVGATTSRSRLLASLPRFGSLVVERGLIELDDQPGRTRVNIELSARDGQPPPQPGAYQARIEGRYRGHPLQLQVGSGSPLPLLEDGAGAPSVAFTLRGRAGEARLSFDGQAAALIGARRLQGELRLSGPSLGRAGEVLGLTLPATPPFEFGGAVAHAGGLWALKVARARIGRSRLSGEFEYDGRQQPRRLVGRLAGPLLLLSDLGPAVGTPGPTGAATPPSSRGRVLPQRRFDLPSLRLMDADVAVAIDQLDFGTPAIRPLRPVQARLLLDDAVLQLRDLQAGSGANRVAGWMQLDARSAVARWGADLSFDVAELADWLPALRSPGPRRTVNPSKPLPPYLSGHLNGRLQVSGQGRSTAEILATLRGRTRLALRDGSMSHLVTEAAGLDLAQGLGLWMRGDQPLPLHCARLDLAITQGVVRPQLALVDNPDSRIRIEGQVDLRSEALALRATVRPKDFSPLSLRTPITVTGTLADPVVGVEGGRLARRLLGAAALGVVVAPVAALLPLVDIGRRDEPPCGLDVQAAAAPASK